MLREKNTTGKSCKLREKGRFVFAMNFLRLWNQVTIQVYQNTNNNRKSFIIFTFFCVLNLMQFIFPLFNLFTNINFFIISLNFFPLCLSRFIYITSISINKKIECFARIISENFDNHNIKIRFY